MKLFLKLKRLKRSLKALNSEAFGDISDRVRKKRAELEELQIASLRCDYNLDCQRQIERVQAEVKGLQDAKERFYRQKARVQWLQEGDHSTKFFHNAVAVKKNKHTIRALVDDKGTKLDTPEQIEVEIIQFYQNLLGCADAKRKHEMIWFGLLRGMKLNKQSLIKVMTGPDGYTAFFFKAAWNIVADDFVDAVKFFFISSKLLGAFNATTGTVDSVIGIWCILQEFYYFSSLQLNVSKTEIFVAGMAKDDLVTVQRVTGFKWEGCL
ncbi:hypothetical protein J1N35_032033 [Gossypium stocksii]|uniref:Reverse transcriptase domain-containing protein n=1 Tax=Gossypium stocksii TaxID=47602 RepID=A0A9D3V301_9ROSI|nr:hypothetical protein J1N35_032033 [Gossypium stocksii]